eukprot:scaffold6397_cov175-Ochromonas_danica.AAC.5
MRSEVSTIIGAMNIIQCTALQMKLTNWWKDASSQYANSSTVLTIKRSIESITSNGGVPALQLVSSSSPSQPNINMRNLNKFSRAGANNFITMINIQSLVNSSFGEII